MFFRSIRFRLTLWYAVTLALIILLFSSLLYVTFRAQLYKEVDKGILVIAESLASPTLAPFRDASPLVFDQVLEDFLGEKAAGKYVQVLDGSGRVTAYTGNLKEFRLPLGKSARREAAQGKTSFETARKLTRFPVRVITHPILEEGRTAGVVQVGASLESAAENLDMVLLVIVVSIPVSLVLFVYGGWFMAGRALRPVEIITASARKITAENLSHRLEVVNPQDEIGRLAETFNNTLARLENAFQKTRQFAADASHELRTPLTILRGEAEVALKWAKEPEEFRAILQSNLEEIRRMTAIIEHLLEVAKAEEGSLALNVEEVELYGLLADLVQQVGLMAREKGVEILFETPGAMIKVDGDPLRLRQLFLNLIVNAVKYSEEGGKVRVVLDAANGQARVAVVDTGSGIPSEDIPHIFDRFYRVDKARNRAQGGIGLGLSLARSFAEAHGGRIEVMSQLGKGSVFTVHLPLSGGAGSAPS